MSGQKAAETWADDAARPGTDSQSHDARGAHGVRKARPGRMEHIHRTRHLSIRARLTLTYAGVVAAVGMVLVVLVYFYMCHITPSVRIGDPVGQTVVTPVLQIGEATKVDMNLFDLSSSIMRSAVDALMLLAMLPGTVGWILAEQMPQLLSSTSTAAKCAASGDLSQWLDLSGLRDEIHNLVDVFNSMLASLGRSFSVHRRFVANASHELRTPLATTRMTIDVALSNPQASAEDLRRVLTRVLETDRANRETIDALLGLADAQSDKLAHEDVDMEATVRGVLSLITSEVVEHHLHVFTCLLPTRVPRDPVLLCQDVFSLLHNAVHYNVEGGRITVGMACLGGDVCLMTRNGGPVVAAESVESLHEPFVRGEGWGWTRDSGHGLGLVIAMVVATAYGSKLHLSANPDGRLTTVLELPVGRVENDSGADDSNG